MLVLGSLCLAFPPFCSAGTRRALGARSTHMQETIRASQNVHHVVIKGLEETIRLQCSSNWPVRCDVWSEEEQKAAASLELALVAETLL